MTPELAGTRLARARAELDRATALGHTRDVASWRIAVEVLGHFAQSVSVNVTPVLNDASGLSTP
jgi:hypothetical protein